MEIDLSRSVLWNCCCLVVENIINPSLLRRNCVFPRFSDGVVGQDEIE